MLALVMLLSAVVGPLTPAHRAFVDDEARFLLSSTERERFNELESDALRQDFIDAFWRRHDRSEQLARRDRAARWFGAAAAFSPRSRVLRQLGPPAFRADLTRAGDRLVPTELWHYVAAEAPSLPRAFYLIFFRPGGAGRFRLWDPELDGVRALVATHEPGRLLVEDDLSVLAAVDPELAAAARELVPGGGPSGSRTLLANVEAFADLADRDRRFQGQVASAARARALAARFVATVWPDDLGVAELHYAVELPPGETRKLDWHEHEDIPGRYLAPIRLIGRISTPAGIRETWDDELWIDSSSEERARLVSSSLSIQGRKLVSADDARVEVAIWSGEASTFVVAPVGPRAIVAVGSRIVETATDPGPFQRGRIQWVPRASDGLGAGPVTILTWYGRSDGPAVSWEVWRGPTLVSADRGPPSRVVELELELEANASYRVRVRHDDEEHDAYAFDTTDRAPSTIRVLARSRNGEEIGRYRLARSLVHIARGAMTQAFEELMPVDVGAHLAVSRRLYALDRHQELLTHLGARALSPPLSREADVFVMLGASAYALGDFDGAAARFEHARTLAPDHDGIRLALERARARTVP